jgi:hypothetical protein
LETSLVILLENFIWEPCLENLGKLSGEPAFSPHSMPLLGESVNSHKLNHNKRMTLCQAALIISQLQAWQKHENIPEIARDKVETGAESQQTP